MSVKERKRSTDGRCVMLAGQIINTIRDCGGAALPIPPWCRRCRHADRWFRCQRGASVDGVGPWI